MKIAVIHDWLVTYAGAERVLEQILHCFPNADLFSVIDFIPDGSRDFILNKSVKTSFIQRLPKAEILYRNYLPLMPLAIEQLDLSGYEVIISSSHAVAKGVLTGPDQFHICYIHSPIRYAWDLQHQYLQESKLNTGLKSLVVRWLLHCIRLWDVRSSFGVDSFITNSYYISRRVNKCYRRDSTVIYPPVNLTQFELCNTKKNYYLTVSRMVPYKKMSLIIEAFSKMPDKQLIVIGDGPDFVKCKSLSTSNISLLGWCSSDEVSLHMQNSKAFIFAAEEDFGITPLEAQACGTPVIAYNKGGLTETIRGLDSTNPTGVFFDEQIPSAIVDAVNLFESNIHLFDPGVCRSNAFRFSTERFRSEFTNFVNEKFKQFTDATMKCKTF